MKNQGGGKNLNPVPVLAEPMGSQSLKEQHPTGEARESAEPTPKGDSNVAVDSRGGIHELFNDGRFAKKETRDSQAETPSIIDRRLNKLAVEGINVPLSARQLQVTLCDNKLAGRLNKAWHSRVPEITWGGTACNPCFACVYDNKIYAVALWSCPIAGNRIVDGFRCLELRRMAVAPDAPKFTASRFLSIMVKMIRKMRPDIFKLISYQDTAVHTGTIYKASGWTLERTTEFVSWGITGRKGHGKLDYQAPSPKNRWALIIREKAESDKLIAPSESQGDLF